VHRTVKCVAIVISLRLVCHLSAELLPVMENGNNGEKAAF